MKRKHFLLLLLAALLIFIAVPVVHTCLTYCDETDIRTVIPKGYTNDASGLNLTKVDSVIDVRPGKPEMIAQLKDIIRLAKMRKTPISVAGARHSMGGHTMYPDGIVVNMLPYKEMKFDPKTIF